MLKHLHIKNFKSIYDETIELGRFNVFIGENGSGKTNILEALGVIGAAIENKLSNDELALKGIRVAKPTITFSSFLGEKQKENINIELWIQDNAYLMKACNTLTTNNTEDIFSTWKMRSDILHIEKNGTVLNIDDYFNEKISEFTKKEGKTLTERLVKTLLVRGLKFSKKKDDNLLEYNNFLDAIKLLSTNSTYTSIGLRSYKIFNLSTQTLRGIGGVSREIPGIRGENLDRLIENFDKEERAKLEKYAYFINWLDKIEIDKEDRHKLKGHKLDMSISILYFRDKYMQRKNNLFSAENANEGVLHILFYLALFISKHTSKLFAIDNIETALNPELCKKLIEQLVQLSKEEGNERQVLITTHSPAVLDGLNLHDPEQRLFKVYRNRKGHTKVKRIELKPDQNFNGQGLKLSELWMRNYLGAIPQNL